VSSTGTEPLDLHCDSLENSTLESNNVVYCNGIVIMVRKLIRVCYSHFRPKFFDFFLPSYLRYVHFGDGLFVRLDDKN
jgi:hypothetical protein